MAKFDLSKKKAKKSDNSEKPRKRKVKRRKKSTATKEERKQLNLELIPVSEKWPPEENIQILTWEKEVEWFLNDAILARQHIERDIQMFGHSRVRYWAFLE